MYSIYFLEKFAFQVESTNTLQDIRNEIKNRLGLPEEIYRMEQNGKLLTNEKQLLLEPNIIRVTLVIKGGKGGFGSMLRAIGAQIEKTTNREACRDLSGRRLRDINEEKRLKTWIAQQVEREKEAEDRRQKKLERLVRIPKHEFQDETYEKERSALPEKVEDALEQGLKASSSMGNKRKIDDKVKQKKKPKLWLGSDEELSSSSDLDSENEETKETENKIECNEKDTSEHKSEVTEIEETEEIISSSTEIEIKT